MISRDLGSLRQPHRGVRARTPFRHAQEAGKLTVVRKALAVWGLCCLGAATAHAQSPADPSEAHPFVAEFHTGSNDPLGRFGLALAYDKGGRFSAGLGLGVDSIHRKLVLGTSLFGRLRLLRAGNFILDTGAILSRGGQQNRSSYGFYESDTERWTMSPEYRLTGTLGVGLVGRRWSLRFESGLGYGLNRPTCTYEGSGTEFSGDCNSPHIPSEYRFIKQPDRLSTTFSLALGYRLGVEDEASAMESRSEYRSPDKARRLSLLSTALPVLFGGAMISLAYSNRSNNVTLPVMGGLSLGLGLSLGPSVGYAYAGESLRGWGVGALRVLGYGLGTIFYLWVTDDPSRRVSRPQRRRHLWGGGPYPVRSFLGFLRVRPHRRAQSGRAYKRQERAHQRKRAPSAHRRAQLRGPRPRLGRPVLIQHSETTEAGTNRSPAT